MNQPAGRTSPMVTFVVRFWHETSAGEVRWRGCIEHVQSGRRVHFSDTDGLLASLQRFSIAMDPQVDGETVIEPITNDELTMTNDK